MSIHGNPLGTILISPMEQHKDTNLAYISTDINTIFYHKEKRIYFLNIRSHACLEPVWPYDIPIYRTGTKKYDYDITFDLSTNYAIHILPEFQAKVFEERKDEFNLWVYLKRNPGVKGPQFFLTDEDISRILKETEENSTKDGVKLPQLTLDDFDEKQKLLEELEDMTQDEINQKLFQLDQCPDKNQKAINWLLDEISRRLKHKSAIKK